MNRILRVTWEVFKKYYFILFGALSLLLPDLLLRMLLNPRVLKEEYVSTVVALFTFGWVFLLLYLCAFVLPKRAGRIVYILISVFFIGFSFSEYIYYKIFDQFFWVRNIVLAGEGANYLGYAIHMMDTRLLIFTVLSVLFLIVAAVKWNHIELKTSKRFLILLVPVLVLSCTHIGMLPELHHDAQNQWDTWRKPRLVYKNFNDVNKSMEATGLYQFVYRNIYKSIFPSNAYKESDFEKVDAYKQEKPVYDENEFTGIFKGKNVIAVMMESIDTWMIDKKHTPTLYKMMKEGIHFTNYNAPFFGAGFTFSSEFAFNTGYFTPVSANSASNFSTHSFPYSVANLFKEAGYTTNSFHFNDSEFYNRGIMHKSFGYEKYNAASEFGITGTEAELDSNLLKSDALYQKMTENTPFFNFFITYSAHLPYTGEDKKLVLAKQYRPDLINENIHEEKNNIQILAADTDEFFAQLLERLEEDGLLENTVIVAYTDHFAYGISDQELLNKWKGKDLSYKVPAFIYAEGIRPMKISKPMMTVDWAPTLVNLFDLNRGGYYTGSDILDPNNKGFVYFETGAWMDEKMHYVPSEEKSYSTKEIEYIEARNQKVQTLTEVNDIIVLGDYYKK